MHRIQKSFRIAIAVGTTIINELTSPQELVVFEVTQDIKYLVIIKVINPSIEAGGRRQGAGGFQGF
jgi:hypothetical protein